MEFLIEYGLFLAKVATVLLALFVLLSMLVGARQQRRADPAGRLEVKHLNEAFEQMTKTLHQAMRSVEAQKVADKEEKNPPKPDKKPKGNCLKRRQKAIPTNPNRVKSLF